jgi:hypothetical protein
MNEPETIDTASHRLHRGTPSAVQSHLSPTSVDFKVMELEIENLRLQRLVAELLLKNQQLRRHDEQGTTNEEALP